jgi:hypothetical protein
MLKNNPSKIPFYEKFKMFKKGPFVVESFVIVALFDCDHMHYVSKSEPYFTLHSPKEIFYHIFAQQFNSLVLLNE